MKILLINQAFYPDVNATAQYLTDLAVDLALKGHAVTVIAGNREYDNPAVRYPARETFNGIRIVRIGMPGFGKKSKWTRIADAVCFQACLSAMLLFFPRQDRVVALTAPPFVALTGILFAKLRRAKFVYWVMDLNPDEAIAAGWLPERSLAARFLKSVAAWTFRHSSAVVVLDRFMKERLAAAYRTNSGKVVAISPWAQDKYLKTADAAQSRFRHENGFEGKFIVMYSGNHSPCHPLDTLLHAAENLRNEKRVVFCFVGGGLLTRHVKEFKDSLNLDNIRQFPYQRLEALADSLTAADLQVVVMGDPYVGILHPCKLYGILAVGVPFVYIGPEKSSTGELVARDGLGDRVAHDDTAGLVSVIEKHLRLGRPEREAYAKKALELKNSRFGRAALSSRMIQLIEGD